MTRKLPERQTQTILLTSMAIFFWLATAIGAFQSVYLQEKGFTATQMGTINAISSGVNILALSFWGMVSDSIGSPKKVLIILLIAGLGLNAMIPLVPTAMRWSYAVMLVVLPLVKFFNGPMHTMGENLLVRNCAEMKLHYGGIRSIASLAYALGGIIAAALIARFSTASTFVAGGLIGIPAIGLLLFIPDTGEAKRVRQNRGEKLNLAELLQNRSYLVFVIFTFLFHMAAYCRLSFMPYYMGAIGLNVKRYGYVTAYAALLEIPSFLLLRRVHKRFDYRSLVLLAVGLNIVEALLLSSVCNSMWMLMFSTTFYGLGNGLFLASSLNYIYEMAPVRLKASAQSFCDAAASIAGILGNLIGGIVFDLLGAKQFYFCILVVYTLSLAILASSSKKGRRQPPEPAS